MPLEERVGAPMVQSPRAAVAALFGHVELSDIERDILVAEAEGWADEAGEAIAAAHHRDSAAVACVRDALYERLRGRT